MTALASCCLCRKALVEGASLRKRKRFHGCTCEVSRNLLNEIMAEFHLSISSYRETNDPDAYICHLCAYQAEKYDRIKREMESIWQSFRDKVLHLNVVVIATGRKRQSQPPSNVDKRCCTTSESQQNSNFINASQIQGEIDAPSQMQPEAGEMDQSNAVEDVQPSTMYTETTLSSGVEIEQSSAVEDAQPSTTETTLSSSAVEIDQSSAVEDAQPSTTETMQSSTIETSAIHHDQSTSKSSRTVSVSKLLCLNLYSYAYICIVLIITNFSCIDFNRL